MRLPFHNVEISKTLISKAVISVSVNTEPRESPEEIKVVHKPGYVGGAAVGHFELLLPGGMGASIVIKPVPLSHVSGALAALLVSLRHLIGSIFTEKARGPMRAYSPNWPAA